MKAIGFKTSLPISQADSFIQFEKETPVPKGYELLVKIQAVSIKPVDYKIRQNSLKDKISDNPKSIGWDAVGVVEDTGNEVPLRYTYPVNEQNLNNANWSAASDAIGGDDQQTPLFWDEE